MIHIAADISYLFPETAATAKTLCEKLISNVFNNGEYVGVSGSLNPKCVVCPECEREDGK